MTSRHAVHCTSADEEYGRCITDILEPDPEKVKKLVQEGHQELVRSTLK